MAGTLQQVDLRPEFARMSDPASFREVLLSILCERGGDFAGAGFTADTVIRIERRKVTAPGVYSVHIRERAIGELADCADLVHADSYVGDFMDEEG